MANTNIAFQGMMGILTFVFLVIPLGLFMVFLGATPEFSLGVLAYIIYYFKTR